MSNPAVSRDTTGRQATKATRALASGDPAELSSNDSAIASGPFSTLPFQQGPDFIERPAIVAWLRDRFKQNHCCVALVGLGGIGKTQLAIRYALDVRASSPDTNILWVQAGTLREFEISYRTIAETLSLPVAGSREPMLRSVCDWLSLKETKRWLMILDDVNHTWEHGVNREIGRKDLVSFIPRSVNGSILITSRSRTAAKRVANRSTAILEVPPMEGSLALQLLRRKLGETYTADSNGGYDNPMAIELVRSLGCIPLAIAQAATYIVHQAPGISISTYLAKLQQQRQGDVGRPNNKPGHPDSMPRRRNLTDQDDHGKAQQDHNYLHSNSIIAAWQMSFESIRRKRTSAVELLAFMSFFDPQRIPTWIISRNMQQEKSASLNESASGVSGITMRGEDDSLEGDLNILREYFLVEGALENDVLKMHPAWRYCTRRWVATGDRLSLSVHAFLSVAGYNRIIVGLSEAMETEKVLRNAIRLEEDTLETKDRNMLTSLGHLGSVLRPRSQYDEAETVLKLALKSREKALEPDDPLHATTVKILNRLSMRYVDYISMYFLLAPEEENEPWATVLQGTGVTGLYQEDQSSRVPLSWAAEQGHVSMVKMIVDANAMYPTSHHGRTPLSLAAGRGHELVVRMLLDQKDVNINSTDHVYNRTPLSWAAEMGHEPVVRTLLETPAIDVNSKDWEGQTALSWAVQKGHSSVVQRLLENSAVDIDLKDSFDRTPLSRAAEKGHESIFRMLLETDAVDVNSKDWRGRTPLYQASWEGHTSIIRMKLETGKADVESTDRYSLTSPHAAVRNRGLDMPKQLQTMRVTRLAETHPDFADEEGSRNAALDDFPGSKVSEFETAIKTLDFDTATNLLTNHFDETAVGKYSWLIELHLIGYSAENIASLLMERSQNGPWIFSTFSKPEVNEFDPDHHMQGCVHNPALKPGNTEQTQPPPYGCDATEIWDKNGVELTVRESIQQLCGVGGLRPATDRVNELNFGSVIFEDEGSTAIISYSGSETRTKLLEVLRDLEQAAGLLQQVDGCCNSFTLLTKLSSVIEVESMKFSTLREGSTLWEDGRKQSWVMKVLSCLSAQADDQDYIRRSPLFTASMQSLAVQLLSIALLSYVQGHCGPLQHCYLDTPLQKILLIGNEIWGPDFEGPCILVSLAELSCFGEMLQLPVFAFEYLTDPSGFTQIIKSEISQTKPKLDLVSRPDDMLDTWGPGGVISAQDDPNQLFAISIGGGLITAVPDKDGDPLIQAHWERGPAVDLAAAKCFSRLEKIRVGAGISTNRACNGIPHNQIRDSDHLSKELGTFPGWWEVAERQVGGGLQAGQTAVALIQFNQTWVKRKGVTKKETLLHTPLLVEDFEKPWGIQVSICTGIARRVRLRHLLADVLPTYVGALVTTPPGWDCLQERDLVDVLRKEGGLRTWVGDLSHELQQTFERLVQAVLILLQDTGVDQKGQYFTIGCIVPNLPFKCFRIPCQGENYWARMVMDSEDIATFAYLTPDCLETETVKCRGPGQTWANSSALFWTAFSCCSKSRAQASEASSSSSVRWTLKHSEAYLIESTNPPMLVRVDRPDNEEEPRLLLSVSRIPQAYLRRMRWMGQSAKLRELKERRALDGLIESAIVSVSQQTWGNRN